MFNSFEMFQGMDKKISIFLFSIVIEGIVDGSISVFGFFVQNWENDFM